MTDTSRQVGRVFLAIVAFSVAFALLNIFVFHLIMDLDDPTWLQFSKLLFVQIGPSLVFAFWVYRGRTHLFPPDGLTRCGRCGYILKELPEPRCPECGQRI